MSLKITKFRLQPYLLGANELKSEKCLNAIKGSGNSLGVAVKQNILPEPMLTIHKSTVFGLGLQNFESREWPGLHDIIMTVVFGMWFYVPSDLVV